MANLKQDLLNNLGNEKYYDELELVRLAQEPNMVYKQKIDLMSVLLKKLAANDLGTQLVGKYFQDPPADAAPNAAQDGQPQVEPVPAKQPEQQPEQPKPHDGQTHGE